MGTGTGISELPHPIGDTLSDDPSRDEGWGEITAKAMEKHQHKSTEEQGEVDVRHATTTSCVAKDALKNHRELSVVLLASLLSSKRAPLTSLPNAAIASPPAPILSRVDAC